MTVKNVDAQSEPSHENRGSPIEHVVCFERDLRLVAANKMNTAMPKVQEPRQHGVAM
jgi:hypothetical protein